jgi:hypothetical protein
MQRVALPWHDQARPKQRRASLQLQPRSGFRERKTASRTKAERVYGSAGLRYRRFIRAYNKSLNSKYEGTTGNKCWFEYQPT